MKRFVLFSLLAVCVLAETRPEPPAADSPAPAGLGPGLYAVIKTSMGTITAKLFEKEAPQTVGAFVALATGNQQWRDPRSGDMVQRPLYRNLLFDRVLPDYVIQTGDPTNTGRYDCGVRLRDEFVTDLQFDRPGRLGIMNFGQPDTGGCGFFITNDAYPALDAYPGNQGYTIFGQVVDGQDVVEEISNVPHDGKDKPRFPVRLASVTIQRVGPGPAVPQPAVAQQASSQPGEPTSRRPARATPLRKLD